MKTLTLFRAYKECMEQYHYALIQMRAPGGTRMYLRWEEEKNKRWRQLPVFENALIKRLQEQEEELERLRKYKSETITRTLARKR